MLSQFTTQSVALRKAASPALPRAISAVRAPAHVAVVLDATAAEAGDTQVEELIQGCLETGVAWLSLCPGGTLPQRAVTIQRLNTFAAAHRKTLLDHGVIVGGIEGPLNIHIVKQTGREELVSAVRSLAEKGIQANALTEPLLREHLPTAHLPAVDLLVHLGGEKSIGAFLTWQNAYAELLFIDVPWKRFTPAHFDFALNDYAQRKRTYGGLK